jgi:DNA mismatch repair protein MutL
MTIRILDSEVVARIAAGEVVERPAAVVKELVENSLDAGATRISVATRGGGVALIQVEDNGGGIPADEMEMAFQRHATSKLASAADLESIATLGFRGEALPSIAAVSEVELVSCTAGGAAGSYLKLNDGVVTGQGGRGRPAGTTVTVRNLFRNVPARLKFLRSTTTENGHIANIVSQYALAYPEVKFNLTVDERDVLSTPGSGRPIDSILAIYGIETARSMIEIKRDGNWGDGRSPSSITVSGLIGAPHLSRTSRDYLSLFVNRRWIGGRLLAKAVEDAYHGLLTVGRHPVAVINIDLPAREVDVNIHPAKSEVKFQNEHQVFGAVQKAVRGTIAELAPVPIISQTATVYSPPARPVSAPSPRPPDAGPGPTSAVPGEGPSSPLLPATPLPWRESLPALRPLGQLAATYIVAEGPEGLYLIDQHAAHERIIFDKLQRQRAKRDIEVQGLLDPVIFEANPRQAAAMKRHDDQGTASLSLSSGLAEFGFSIERFGTSSYLIRAVPAGLGGKGCVAALRELLDTPADGTDWREQIAQSIACHSAVRSGQVLSHDEMRQLLRELEQTTSPHTCPHGRPTMTHLSLGGLAKEFRRT